MQDLLETPEAIPANVQALLDNFELAIDSGHEPYKVCRALEDELDKAGYSIEYGLDASPYNLQKKPEQTKPAKWTREELKAAVIVYDEMHRKDKAGESFSKAAYYKKLAAEHERSAKSFEYRMQNISHVYQLLGLGFVTGLKPASNVGANVIKEIKSIIAEVR